jgi:large subunit ribosomal protein L15
MPKRGFNNAAHCKTYMPVNLPALNRFSDGTVVDEPLLRSVGLANGRADGVKVLGGGKLDRRLTVRAQAFSQSAKSKIEALGGVCEILQPNSTP